ncbi:helix-turn-helix domain-containing protein [Mycobacteroides abscessus]|uniref:helix-turn-helix domain-containing protein n=1 Tax=Mycobacteroides abscessus TaxID=36809 RepID=UPI000C25A79B|nr:helix-turn-helix transcriptional regulator [Mycobacteroides abscessus]RIU41057.1 XRE family transcriptional regulator [Mycobacteroides abscessus]
MSKISMSDLVEGHAARVGRQIKALRAGRSGQWLADRTSALGYGVARTTISELENGKRSFVTTGELTALAVALSVPPVALLFPLGWGDAEAAEETNVESMQWFTGDYVPSVTSAVERETGVECDRWLYETTTNDVRRTRERNGLVAKQVGLRDRLMKLVREGAGSDEIAKAVDELDEVSRQIGRNGG